MWFKQNVITYYDLHCLILNASFVLYLYEGA